MKKNKNMFMALFVGIVMVSGSILQPLSGTVPSRAAGNPLCSGVVRRVMDEQAGDVWHYHYEDASGTEVEPETAVQLNENDGLRRKTAALSDIPSEYDPRGTEEETPIRDQTDTGACWAFAALKSLEGNAITQGLYTAQEADFSESHLAWYTYRALKDKTHPLYGDYMKSSDIGMFGDTVYDQGGHALMAAYTLANGWGAVEESDAPFSTGAEMTEAMESLGDSIRERSVVRMTMAECYDEADRDEIKQAVLDNKAVDVSLYYPVSDAELERYMYEDDETCSLYSDDFGIDDANHCVTIVGWDDNYNTFCQQPQQSGAWLIANSYGEEYNDGGYFWVSYYDTSLCDYYVFRGETADHYATAFQYDGAGWGAYYPSEEDIRVANVFTNETDQPQELSSVSFYTLADSQSYEVQIYRNLGTGGPLDGEWVERCTTAGVAEHSGYRTVSLQQPIIVAPGERFSAVVTFYADGGFAYAALEGSNDPFNMAQYDGSAGQSYLYLTEEWRPQWYDTVEEGLNNICVKTLANPVAEEAYEEQQKDYVPSVPTTEPTMTPPPAATPVIQNPLPGMEGNNGTASGNNIVTGKTVIGCTGKITMGVGEKVKLKVSVSPKQGISYQSSNAKVATVKKNGTITGKKAGTARITVSASGVQKKVTVRVKKAPKSIRLTAGKKTVKKGKTCKLKVRFAGNSASYSLKYKSMNPGIASVSSAGKVKAKKAGTAKIQVKAFNGKKAYAKIKVVS